MTPVLLTLLFVSDHINVGKESRWQPIRKVFVKGKNMHMHINQKNKSLIPSIVILAVTLFIYFFPSIIVRGSKLSGGELLEIRLLDNHLINTFGRKSTARHKIYQLLESSLSWLNWIRANDKTVTTARQCRAVDTQFFATVKCKSSIFFIQKLSTIYLPYMLMT